MLPYAGLLRLNPHIHNAKSRPSPVLHHEAGSFHQVSLEFLCLCWVQGPISAFLKDKTPPSRVVGSLGVLPQWYVRESPPLCGGLVLRPFCITEVDSIPTALPSIGAFSGRCLLAQARPVAASHCSRPLRATWRWASRRRGVSRGPGEARKSRTSERPPRCSSIVAEYGLMFPCWF